MDTSVISVGSKAHLVGSGSSRPREVGGRCNHTHLTDEEGEAWRGSASYLRPPSFSLGEGLVNPPLQLSPAPQAPSAPMSASLPSAKTDFKGPKWRQAGRRAQQPLPHQQPQLFQAPCPAGGQSRGRVWGRPVGAAGSCACLSLPCIHLSGDLFFSF